MYGSNGKMLFADLNTRSTRVLSLPDMAGMVAAITGWETSGYEIMCLGETCLTLFRLYNCREGLNAADGMLPDRFYEEAIDCGMHAEAALYDFDLDWVVE